MLWERTVAVPASRCKSQSVADLEGPSRSSVATGGYGEARAKYTKLYTVWQPDIPNML